MGISKAKIPLRCTKPKGFENKSHILDILDVDLPFQGENLGDVLLQKVLKDYLDVFLLGCVMFFVKLSMDGKRPFCGICV